MDKVWPNETQIWLLKACLFSGRSAQDAWENWTARVDFNKIDPASYNLLPLISRNAALTSLQDPIFEKCKGVYRQTWVMNRLQWGKALSVLAQLCRAGIDKILLLKGMAMILHYYQDFGVRVIGDIDIFIQREQLPLADSFFRASGWKQSSSRIDLRNPEHLKRWHALSFIHKARVEIDLHWSFIQENSPSVDESVFSESRRLDDIQLYMPNCTDLLLQTCVHGMKYSPIPLIRWVADAVTILKNSEKEMNWERLVELAKKARVCIPLRSALQFLVDRFDVSIPQKAIEELAAVPSSRLEALEYRSNVRGYCDMAEWRRYCLNRAYLTIGSQILHLPKYLQLTARLKSPWLIPPFALYWILKRLYRFILRSR